MLPTTNASAPSCILESATVALNLKIAYAATEVLPIVGQILGSASHISEFADVRQSTPDRAPSNCGRAEAPATQGCDVRAGRALGHICAPDRGSHGGWAGGRDAASPLAPSLLVSLVSGCPVVRSRHCRVFSRIEAFMLKESSVKGRLKRIIRSIFVAPNYAATLAVELEREIQLFQVSTSRFHCW